jgi:hypothetical protein
MRTGDRQRSEAEWKFGMDAPPQNAFVSGWPKKAYERLEIKDVSLLP